MYAHSRAGERKLEVETEGGRWSEKLRLVM